jgi:hypothetical protein
MGLDERLAGAGTEVAPAPEKARSSLALDDRLRCGERGGACQGLAASASEPETA